MRYFWRILLAVSIFPGTALIAAIGGLFTVCHRSALNPVNFFADGQCQASDTPNEVFTSFLMLGCLLAAILAAVVLVASRVKQRYLEGKG